MALASRELRQQRFPANPACLLHKPKRVSWASEGSLCQIRLFLSEDAPEQSGLLSSQDLLQAKRSSASHSTVTGLDDGAPPGFEGPRSASQFKGLSKLHIIKWKYPPSFVLNPAWEVVAGQESKEIIVQNQRQLRVLEAIYPRTLSIPPSPSVAPEANEDYSDLRTPLIPLTSVEEDELTECLDSIYPTDGQKERLPESIPVIMQRPTSSVSDFISPGEQFPTPNSVNVSSPSIATKVTTSFPAAEPDVAAAASAAFTALMKSNEEGSLVDRNLLIKILSDPSLVEKLVQQGSSLVGTAAIQTGNKHQFTAPMPLPLPASLPGRPDIAVPVASQPSADHLHANLNPMPSSVTNLQQPNNMLQVTGRKSSSPTRVKDINYYKSLIQKHGEEKHGFQEQGTMLYQKHPNKLFDQVSSDKLKTTKPCIYYNSPKGCWHGSNCIYLHDDGDHWPIREISEGPSAKRVKMD